MTHPSSVAAQVNETLESIDHVYDAREWHTKAVMGKYPVLLATS